MKGPHLRPRPGPASDDPWLAVLARRRTGERAHFLVPAWWTRSVSEPEDDVADVADVTAVQVRRVVGDLIVGGQ
jgi:hypothetical protein